MDETENDDDEEEDGDGDDRRRAMGTTNHGSARRAIPTLRNGRIRGLIGALTE